MADTNGIIYDVTGSVWTQFTRQANTAQSLNANMFFSTIGTSGSSGGGGGGGANAVTYYRGVSGSQFVYSTDTPPQNATDIVIIAIKYV